MDSKKIIAKLRAIAQSAPATPLPEALKRLKEMVELKKMRNE